MPKSYSLSAVVLSRNSEKKSGNALLRFRVLPTKLS